MKLENKHRYTAEDVAKHNFNMGYIQALDDTEKLVRKVIPERIIELAKLRQQDSKHPRAIPIIKMIEMKLRREIKKMKEEKDEKKEKYWKCNKS